MIPAILAIVFGFALLVWSADRFIIGSASTADHFGMPPLLIGITIVGFGTSMPEMLVSAQAALDGNPDLSLGNALGSNIINIGLVLGVTALIAPISVHSKIIKKEIPVLLIIGTVFGCLILDKTLSRLDSVLLLSGFLGLMGLAIIAAMRERHDHFAEEVKNEFEPLAINFALFWLVFGLALMLVSARVLIWGAIELAVLAGVSNLVIGLTIVAFGTSLPELTASVVAALKNQHDIAIGNVVGSNMFNLLAVAGIAGVITPIKAVSSSVLLRDWPAVMLFAIALWGLAYGRGREGRISRVDGAVLCIGFAAYLYVLFGLTYYS